MLGLRRYGALLHRSSQVSSLYLCSIQGGILDKCLQQECKALLYTVSDKFIFSSLFE